MCARPVISHLRRRHDRHAVMGAARYPRMGARPSRRYGQIPWRIPYVRSTSEYPFSPVMVNDRYPLWNPLWNPRMGARPLSRHAVMGKARYPAKSGTAFPTVTFVTIVTSVTALIPSRRHGSYPVTTTTAFSHLPVTNHLSPVTVFCHPSLSLAPSRHHPKIPLV